MADISEQNINDLRSIGRDLGIPHNTLIRSGKDQIIKMIEEKKRGPMNPDDFGDLGPLRQAPDKIIDLEEKEPEPKPPPPQPPPPPPVIVISPKEAVMAIKNGLSGGIPIVKGQVPYVLDEEIILGEEGQEIHAVIAGNAVKCTIVNVKKIKSWSVEGSADDFSGKYRLLNDVTMVNSQTGCTQKYKAGQEFFKHQVDFEGIKKNGGHWFPIGIQK
jgi:hypothetical protein